MIKKRFILDVVFLALLSFVSIFIYAQGFSEKVKEFTLANGMISSV